jgi:glycosyltransferase involved in cell wall biosynthesis
MELLAASVDQELRGLRPTHSVTLGRSQRHLSWFLPMAGARTAWRLARRDVEWVVCGDPVVLTALRPALSAARVKVAVVVHGLDLVFPNRPYRALIRRALARADRVLTISAATRKEALRLGISAEKLVDLHPGLPHPPATDREAAGRVLRQRLGLVESSFLVSTVGRLVPRKGVRFFVTDVLPALPRGVHYLVAGEGPEEELIRRAAATAGVADRVHLLGRVSDADRDALFDGTDAVVMPNLPRPGDMEGFGLVALEAALRAAPVLAARIDGLEDALLGGMTGWLCRPGDADDWIDRVRTLVASDRDELRRLGSWFSEEARRNFSPRRMRSELSAALVRTDVEVLVDLRADRPQRAAMGLSPAGSKS